MAVNDRGLYTTNNGSVPGIVLAQYQSDGTTVVADGAAGENTNVQVVDVLLLGIDAGRRYGVSRGSAVNEFEFTDTLTA